MNLVNSDFTLSSIRFKCLDTNRVYTITGSSDVGRGVSETLDTIVRDDDEKRKVRRRELKLRFKNIEPINMFYVNETKKRSKTKGRR